MVGLFFVVVGVVGGFGERVKMCVLDGVGFVFGGGEFVVFVGLLGFGGSMLFNFVGLFGCFVLGWIVLGGVGVVGFGGGGFVVLCVWVFGFVF